MLALDGLRRGGITGLAETTAGGAMIGFKFGGPVGAAIGAAAGAVAGIVRLFVKGAQDKVWDGLREGLAQGLDDRLRSRVTPEAEMQDLPSPVLDARGSSTVAQTSP
ncbi:MAG: hypothetical protein NTY38_02670 [Acidobacteria bacterium]|nr:hypothetical protein [Acidobacteriota bacterium]